MTRALSNDLRKRVVEAIVARESCRAAAARFGVAVSSAVKWSERYRATGSVAPRQDGRTPQAVLAPHRAFIVERFNQTSELMLHRLKDELAARGVKVLLISSSIMPASRVAFRFRCFGKRLAPGSAATTAGTKVGESCCTVAPVCALRGARRRPAA